MFKIAVMVSGGGTNLQAIIDSVSNNEIHDTEISVVISNKKDAYALERARNAGILSTCVSPSDYPDRAAFEKALLETVDSYGVDLIVLAGYLVILPEGLVKQYENRIINIHPSLIPSFCGMGYYGLKVHEGVLARGNKLTGATVHFVDSGADTGPILIQKAVEVKEDDTPEVLQKRVMVEAEWKILPQAIDLIARGKVTVKNGKTYISE